MLVAGATAAAAAVVVAAVAVVVAAVAVADPWLASYRWALITSERDHEILLVRSLATKHTRAWYSLPRARMTLMNAGACPLYAGWDPTSARMLG